jgi:DNA-directed RNA polymerase subunit RPC12/RpoP
MTYKCPECSGPGTFRISGASEHSWVSVWIGEQGDIQDTDTSSSETTWEPDDDIECCDCGHKGVVRDFTDEYSNADSAEESPADQSPAVFTVFRDDYDELSEGVTGMWNMCFHDLETAKKQCEDCVHEMMVDLDLSPDPEAIKWKPFDGRTDCWVLDDSTTGMVLTILKAEINNETHPGTFVQAPPEQRFLLQNVGDGFVGNSPVFWHKSGSGYTQWIDDAKLWTKEEAEKQIKSTRGSHRWQMWDIEEITPVAKRTVDIQDLRKVSSPQVS